jgi:uncharacterized protein YqgC (DUF456 family)
MPSATDHSANGGRLGWMLPHFFLGAISVPLLAAFWVEFIWQRSPLHALFAAADVYAPCGNGAPLDP